mmetsp:Transcript_17330/g.26497  ORF Transcript_17330/g.26497 Transcript_17330/m.26497 type:complete len:205 (-) Transcript_17330:262-876(-)
MIPPAPRSPYPKRAGTIMRRRSPTPMVLKLSSHPRITCPTPTLNRNGRLRSRLESNFFSLSNPSSQPVYCATTSCPGFAKAASSLGALITLYFNPDSVVTKSSTSLSSPKAGGGLVSGSSPPNESKRLVPKAACPMKPRRSVFSAFNCTIDSLLCFVLVVFIIIIAWGVTKLHVDEIEMLTRHKRKARHCKVDNMVVMIMMMMM